jgi:threonine/homoserine/homoserine lactone efflux protein
LKLMETHSFWEGIVAGYGIAVPVGAIAVLIIDTGIRRGLKHGMQAGAGAAAADLIYASLAALSGSLLQSWLLPVAGLFRVLGGGALIAIGGWGLWRLWRTVKLGVDQSTLSASARGTFLTFLGLTLLNPLTIVYFSALILGTMDADRSDFDRLAFVLGAGMASLSWQWLLAAFGAFAGRTLPPKAGQTFSALGNLVVIFLGVRLLF